MLSFGGEGILLDVEGTTSSIRFVYDVLFPLARRHLDEFLEAHWDDAEVVAAREQIARDVGTGRGVTSPGRETLRDEVLALMDADAKTIGLKQLQGLIWKSGWKSGELVSHVYPDVAPALDRWRREGIDVRIYSSGSVQAQKLFFAHTEHGNLREFLSGHFDTGVGAKRESASYVAIADVWRLAPERILFVSDVCEELDAARAAGMRTALSVREGNAPVREGHGHPVVTDFGQIATSRDA